MTKIMLEIKTPTGFRLESEMFRPVMDAIPEKFPAENRATRVLREAVIGNVVPDLLIGQWEADDDSSVPQFTNIARHVLALLQRSGPSTIESVQCKLYLSESALTRAISVLCRAGALSQDQSNGKLHVSPDFAKRTNLRLIAIEMKMKRWREALEQAIRYLSFADEAYVVLDGEQVEYTHEMRRAFELAAPGLYFQHGTELRKVLDCAPVPSMPSADRLLAMQKLRSSGPHCFA